MEWRRISSASGLFSVMICRAGVVLDRETGVHQLAVDLAGQGGLGQAGADGSGHVLHGNGVIKRPLAAVG
ncbi:hypothetical protein UU5_12598 [Rhodanobacter sp. 115]|nr:hypothetical protein UU5_12598 [Rhodanobacter sp. 115]